MHAHTHSHTHTQAHTLAASNRWHMVHWQHFDSTKWFYVSTSCPEFPCRQERNGEEGVPDTLLSHLPWLFHGRESSTPPALEDADVGLLPALEHLGAGLSLVPVLAGGRLDRHAVRPQA